MKHLEVVQEELRSEIIKLNKLMSLNKINKTNTLRFYGMQTTSWYDLVSGKTKYWYPSFKDKFLRIISDYKISAI